MQAQGRGGRIAQWLLEKPKGFVGDVEFLLVVLTPKGLERLVLQADGTYWFVSENATVGDGRTVMASIKNCNDVFVTANGQREERAIGWLTNTLLAGVQ